jgi:hypothetical protein
VDIVLFPLDGVIAILNANTLEESGTALLVLWVVVLAVLVGLRILRTFI